MTTAIDTNVVIALWEKDPGLSLAAQNALEAAFNRGTLVAAAPVFAELLAAPGRTETFVGLFFEETGIAIDWQLGEPVWRSAGRAFRAYAEGRRKQRDATRRMLADFLIGGSCSREWLPATYVGRSFIPPIISNPYDRDLLSEYTARYAVQPGQQP